ncbi:MAG: DUF4249 family protein [Ignavibacteria bacterium]|nr:DUF4249 family protein [Ignavibacteria bacterium]
MNKIILILFLALMLTSCEQVVDLGSLPHEEKLFIEGVLSPNEDIEICVSRTLPPLDTSGIFPNGDIDSLATRVSDMTGTITVDGEVYALKHIGFGRYRIFNSSNQPIKGKPGSSYMLFGKWKDAEISASTKIPLEPTSRFIRAIIDTQRRMLSWGGEYVKVLIETESMLPLDETWSLSITVRNAMNFEVKEFFDQDPSMIQDSSFIDFGYRKYILSNNRPQISTFMLYLNADPLLSNAEVLQAHAETKIIIRSFDKAWKAFMDTQYLGEGFSGIFGGTETGIQWNIKGKGLGIFVGRHETHIPFTYL